MSFTDSNGQCLFSNRTVVTGASTPCSGLFQNAVPTTEKCLPGWQPCSGLDSFCCDGLCYAIPREGSIVAAIDSSAGLNNLDVTGPTSISVFGFSITFNNSYDDHVLNKEKDFLSNINLQLSKILNIPISYIVNMSAAKGSIIINFGLLSNMNATSSRLSGLLSSANLSLTGSNNQPLNVASYQTTWPNTVTQSTSASGTMNLYSYSNCSFSMGCANCDGQMGGETSDFLAFVGLQLSETLNVSSNFFTNMNWNQGRLSTDLIVNDSSVSAVQISGQIEYLLDNGNLNLADLSDNPLNITSFDTTCPNAVSSSTTSQSSSIDSRSNNPGSSSTTTSNQQNSTQNPASTPVNSNNQPNPASTPVNSIGQTTPASTPVNGGTPKIQLQNSTCSFSIVFGDNYVDKVDNQKEDFLNYMATQLSEHLNVSCDLFTNMDASAGAASNIITGFDLASSDPSLVVGDVYKDLSRLLEKNDLNLVDLSDNPLNITSYEAKCSSAQQDTTTEVPIQQNSAVTIYSFSITCNADYDKLVMNNKKDFLDYILVQLSETLNISCGLIANLNATRGSVVITFNLISDDGYSKLLDLLDTGGLQLLDLNHDRLNVTSYATSSSTNSVPNSAYSFSITCYDDYDTKVHNRRDDFLVYTTYQLSEVLQTAPELIINLNAAKGSIIINFSLIAYDASKTLVDFLDSGSLQLLDLDNNLLNISSHVTSWPDSVLISSDSDRNAFLTLIGASFSNIYVIISAVIGLVVVIIIICAYVWCVFGKGKKQRAVEPMSTTPVMENPEYYSNNVNKDILVTDSMMAKKKAFFQGEGASNRNWHSESVARDADDVNRLFIMSHPIPDPARYHAPV